MGADMSTWHLWPDSVTRPRHGKRKYLKTTREHTDSEQLRDNDDDAYNDNGDDNVVGKWL